MNDLARQDIDRLCSYIFNNEEEDFAESLLENPQMFPGLTDEEQSKLDTMLWGSEEWVALLDKAALCEANEHPYACAFRLHKEFLEKPQRSSENIIRGSCPGCGREEVDHEGNGLAYWYSPCPADDCPSNNCVDCAACEGSGLESGAIDGLAPCHKCDGKGYVERQNEP